MGFGGVSGVSEVRSSAEGGDVKHGVWGRGGMGGGRVRSGRELRTKAAEGVPPPCSVYSDRGGLNTPRPAAVKAATWISYCVQMMSSPIRQ